MTRKSKYPESFRRMIVELSYKQSHKEIVDKYKIHPSVIYLWRPKYPHLTPTDTTVSKAPVVNKQQTINEPLLVPSVYNSHATFYYRVFSSILFVLVLMIGLLVYVRFS